ncbi:signal recognition particle-docking protein FtsY [Candidatus Woesearchaeota archaeon]|nr:signal recognition particle-docking protein FtsY [Candidatus Woesearchaeota archaeon]
MFKFLKKAVEKFSKKVETAPPDTTPPIKEKEKPKVQSETKVSAVPKELKKLEEKQTWLQRVSAKITDVRLSEQHFERLFAKLEKELLQSNVALRVVGEIESKLKADLVGKSLRRNDVVDIIKTDLRELISHILEAPKPIDVFKFIEDKKKKGEFTTIMFVGPNGHGKTTTLAKLAYLLKQKGYRCVFAAGDTWRTAAIEQLQYHADKLGIQIVKHSYGADPAAVAYDAVRVKDKDVVLIDTAGRSHANVNLMDEMKKIKRVAKPDLVIFVGESLAGNDCVEQVKSFHAAVGVDGMILTKVDADEKGGALISTTYAIKKPIMFIGIGQNYSDLEPFDANRIIRSILD